MISDKLNKNEIKIIKSLPNSESTSQKISELAEVSGLSYFSIRNIIKSLYLSGICEKGRKDGNADSYFLTNKGIEIKENELT